MFSSLPTTVSPPIIEGPTDQTTALLSPPGGSVVVSGTATNRSIKLLVFTTSTVMYETKTGTPLNGQSISSKQMTGQPQAGSLLVDDGCCAVGQWQATT